MQHPRDQSCTRATQPGIPIFACRTRRRNQDLETLSSSKQRPCYQGPHSCTDRQRPTYTTQRRRKPGEAHASPDAPIRWVLLLFLRDGRFCGLEADLAVGAVTERLGDRRAAPAQREPRPSPARVELVAVDVYQLDFPFHEIRAVGPDADLDRH